jgi:hypothetical protein
MKCYKVIHRKDGKLWSSNDNCLSMRYKWNTINNPPQHPHLDGDYGMLVFMTEDSARSWRRCMGEAAGSTRDYGIYECSATQVPLKEMLFVGSVVAYWLAGDMRWPSGSAMVKDLKIRKKII